MIQAQETIKKSPSSQWTAGKKSKQRTSRSRVRFLPLDLFKTPKDVLLVFVTAVFCVVGFRPYLWLAEQFLRSENSSDLQGIELWLLNTAADASGVLEWPLKMLVGLFQLIFNWPEFFLGLAVWLTVIYFQTRPASLFGKDNTLGSVTNSIQENRKKQYFSIDEDDPWVVRSLKQNFNKSPYAWAERVYMGAWLAIGFDALICVIFYGLFVTGWTLQSWEIASKFSPELLQILDYSGIAKSIVAVFGLKTALEHVIDLSKEKEYAGNQDS